MDVIVGGTQSENSKHDTFYNIDRPNTRVDLRMFIGLLNYKPSFPPCINFTLYPEEISCKIKINQ